MRYGPDLDWVITLPIDVQESDRYRVQDSLHAYLRGKQSLDWAVGIIRSSMFKGETLGAILDNLEQVLTLDDLGKQKMAELRNELAKKDYL